MDRTAKNKPVQLLSQTNEVILPMAGFQRHVLRPNNGFTGQIGFKH